MEESSMRRDGLGEFNCLPDELLCQLLGSLELRDVATMASVSKVFYVFCNEEPLWMKLCLSNHQEVGLVYKGSWKLTAIEACGKSLEVARKPVQVQGFSSLYLYRRWYRCNVSLENFVFDVGAIERRRSLSAEDFVKNYDMKKPVLLLDLTEQWPARQTWTLGQLVARYGDAQLKVSQSYGRNIRMSLRDYSNYMKVQHDEDPLYIFDSTFGETVPELLDDYRVPDLFKEDLFSVLSFSQRPPFRWLVIGPARSGANWHVDPALTSAWNTLLSGRKRWAFYPPGRVPPGVYVHVDEDTGEIHYDGPTSLQWWLEVYPGLESDAKPLECTQLPGETIFVPSGWWHCVLNIEETVAVTQNFVNSRNLELVCLDMAPGYHHRGIARAGFLALEEEAGDSHKDFMSADMLKKYVEKHPDHFLSETNNDGLLNRRDLRDWLRKLQVARPDLKPEIWKSACLAVDANAWLQRLKSVCKAHGFQPPDEQLIPLGNGSSPVYLVGDHAIKLYIHEEGIMAALREIESELQFYTSLEQSGSALKDYVPTVVAKGLVFLESDDKYIAAPAAENSEVISTGTSVLNSGEESKSFWPYLVTRRCEGQNLAQCRSMMTDGDYVDLAAFLGRQLHNLHSLTVPVQGNKAELLNSVKWTCSVPDEWQDFVNLLRVHRLTLMTRLKEWASVPRRLLEKVEQYVPEDPVVLIGLSKIENGCAVPCRAPAPLHMDIMQDNIQMVPYTNLSHDKRLQARYLFDFGDLRHGDSLYELVPLYTDVLEINTELLQHYLESYSLPLAVDGLRTSYRAMCYCLLYKYDAMDSVFRIRKELRMVESWHELELIVWGALNEEDVMTTTSDVSATLESQ